MPTQVRASKEEALKSLQSMRSGVAAALSSHEEELKRSVKTGASAEGGGGVTASMDAAAESAGLLELDANTFWPFIKETAGDALVVVDFYTTWCGPCKLMMPKLAAMSAARGGKMVAVKFECNAANKEVGKELGIKSVPTFQLWKGGEKVAVMTGAKPDELEKLIDEHL